MLHIVLMFMLVLSVMSAALVRSTITSLKISMNYYEGMRFGYLEEGLVERALHGLKTGQDRDGDGVEDFQQVHGNGESLYYLLDGAEVTVERDPADPHQAIITVGQVSVIVNNFPGGGQSCQNNSQCTPERVAWQG